MTYKQKALLMIASHLDKNGDAYIDSEGLSETIAANLQDQHQKLLDDFTLYISTLDISSDAGYNLLNIIRRYIKDRQC